MPGTSAASIMPVSPNSALAAPSRNAKRKEPPTGKQLEGEESKQTPSTEMTDMLELEDDEEDAQRVDEDEDETMEAAAAASSNARSKIHSKNVISCTHPRGVKPLGNQLFEGCASIRGGFGFLGRAFSDSLLLDLLRTHLLAEDLVALNLVSKAFYILSNEEELWREMALHRWEGAFEFQKDWKNTYSFMLHRERKGATAEAAAQWQPLPAPLKFEGFYSDEIFQAFYCAHIDLQGSFDNVTDNIERVHFSELSEARFKTEFGIPNKPVIITGLMDSWPCYSSSPEHYSLNWNQANWLSAYGDAPFKIGRYVMPLRKYFQYMDQIRSDESPLYLFDSKFGDKHPELLSHYTVPSYFSHDFFNLLNSDAKVRPAFRWILVGPERSGSTFHKDPNHTSAWNGLISGKKKWIMYPPSVTPPGVIPSSNGAEVATPISVSEWFINNYGEHRRRVEEYEEKKRYERGVRERSAKAGAAAAAPSEPNGPASKKQKLVPSSSSDIDPPGPVEATCQPGEIIFIPNGWWHTALNLTPSFAVTQNYVNEENIWNVCDFLASDEGERDRNLTLLSALESALSCSHSDIYAMVEQKKIEKEIEAQEKAEAEERKKGKKKSSLWERLTS